MSYHCGRPGGPGDGADVVECWCGERGTFDELFAPDALRQSCGGSRDLACLCGGDFCACHYHGATECPGCEDCEYDGEADFGEFDPYDPDDCDGDL